MSSKNEVASPEPADDQKFQAPTTQRVVVVLGSGRSGTSLCAKILSKLGIAMETTLQRPNEMNPEGYFEDAQLVEINKRLLKKLAPVSGVAPSIDFADSKIDPEFSDLRRHLRERSDAASSVWGFKDPRVSTLLPIYRRAFQSEGIVPIYVFCARSAGAVVESLMQTGMSSRESCEQLYYMRTFLSLRDTAANCHVLHYEKLLDAPVKQIKNLWTHIDGSDRSFPLGDIDCNSLIDSKLNRSSLQAKCVSNPLAARMEKLINSMEGMEFDRDEVFQEIRKIDALNSGYQIWVDRAVRTIYNLRLEVQKRDKDDKSGERLAKAIEQRDKAVLRAEKADERVLEMVRQRDEAQIAIERNSNCTTALEKELSKLQAEKALLDKERNAAIARARSREAELKLLRRQLEQSEAKLTRSEQSTKKLQTDNDDLNSQLASAKSEIDRLSGSVRHRAGTLLVDAVQRPGWNTLVLPWRIARLRSDDGSGGTKP